MSKTYNHYVEGKLVATYNQSERPRFKSLKEIIQRRKYAQRDARLVQIITR